MRRTFGVLMVIAIGVILGCSSPVVPEPENKPVAPDNTQAQVRELEARVKELQARSKELADRISSQSRSVTLVNPNYPPAVGGTPGWKYHLMLAADLNSDGQQERVSVTTNAEWIPEKKEFGWDDGHPWHVYVEETDGRRTYLFSDWVQMGRLEVILDRDGPGLYIVSSRGGSLTVYRATYRGPGQVTTVEAFDIPLSESATWADPLLFSR